MKLISGVFRINDTLYDFCGIYKAVFFWGGGDVLSKGFNFNSFANIDFYKNAARREVYGRITGAAARTFILFW